MENLRIHVVINVKDGFRAIKLRDVDTYTGKKACQEEIILYEKREKSRLISRIKLDQLKGIVKEMSDEFDKKLGVKVCIA